MCYHRYVTTRALILQEAERLLADSASGDISTRAVCEAAGVTQPVLYRLFGDKDGLLTAVADEAWARYLNMKRAATPSEDPLADLQAGWDNHTDFALSHPSAYRLVFSTTLRTRPTAFDEAMTLLTQIMDRLAAQGRLRYSPAIAAQIVMAANSGVALSLIQRADSFADRTVSEHTRDAVLAGILTDSVPVSHESAAQQASTTLRAQLDRSSAFTPAEAGLLTEWLDRF